MEMKAVVSMLLLSSLFGLNTCVYRKHLYVKEKMTWSEALKFCKTYHDDLSMINSEELQRLSNDLDITTIYWIGLHRDDQDQKMWRWSGGEALTIEEWDEGEPNFLSEMCAGVMVYTSKLHDIPCEWILPFYCMDVFQLILVQQYKTWEEALDYCRQHYIDLASLRSDAIMEEAVNITAAAHRGDVWTGLRFIAGHWFWVNGEDLVYKAWYNEREDQCPTRNQRCGALNREENVWKPKDCEMRLNFLCVTKA